jgi:DNA-binding transcriptional ArsR family regulator
MFHYLVKEDEFLPAREINQKGLKALQDKQRRKILNLLSEKEMTVSDMEEQLNIGRQTLYYNLEKLQNGGLIDSEGSKPKHFTSDIAAYYFKPENVEPEENPVMLDDVPEMLEGFIKDRRVKARIVVGAPYPHGENNRRHRTSYKVGDIACELGNYGSRSKQLVYTDVEAQRMEEAPEIMVGGFRVNELTRNSYTKFPIKFSASGDEILTKSGNSYTGADTGYVTRTEIDGVPKMIAAGISGLGTSAAIKSLASRVNQFGKEGVVVRGYGTKELVEEVEILEKI